MSTMSNLSVWRPFSLMNEIFDDVLSKRDDDLWSFPMVLKDSHISKRKLDDKEFYVVECDVPGVKKEDIEIEFDSRTSLLSVKAQRKKEDSTKNYNFKFSINSDSVLVDSYQVSLEDGVLSISFEFKNSEPKEVVKKLEFKA